MGENIISISVVLSLISQTVFEGEAQSHHIVFCKKDGTISEIKRAAKSWKDKPTLKKDDTGRQYAISQKDSNLLLVTDLDTMKPKNIVIDGILYFNGSKVWK